MSVKILKDASMEGISRYSRFIVGKFGGQTWST